MVIRGASWWDRADWRDGKLCQQPCSDVHGLKHMSVNIMGFQDMSQTCNKDVISTGIHFMGEAEGRTLYLIFARYQIVLEAASRQLN